MEVSIQEIITSKHYSCVYTLKANKNWLPSRQLQSHQWLGGCCWGAGVKVTEAEALKEDAEGRWLWW